MFLPPSPPSIVFPAAGGFPCSRQRFRFGFCRTHRGRQGLRRSPVCRDDRRRADSFSRSSTQGGDSVETTGTTVCVSPGSPAPPTAKPSSDRMSTSTHRRTATAAGNAHPSVDYGFGSGVAPRLSTRRASTPPRVKQARPAPPTAATPAPAASPIPTVPIPSDRDRAEPVGTPFVRLPSPPGDTPTAPTKLDALGDAAELQFVNSVARYSHAHWEREQQAEPTCHALKRYITIGRPSAWPPNFLSFYASHHRPSLSDIQELADKGRSHTTDDNIILLVRNPTPPPTPDAPSSVGRAGCLLNARTYSHLRSPIHAPLDHASLPFDGFLPPWHHAHIAHAGAVLLVDRYERVHPVVASPLLEVPSGETPRLTVRWPIISMPPPEGPGIAISVDYIGPLPVKPQGNTYILLITDVSVVGPICSPSLSPRSPLKARPTF